MRPSAASVARPRAPAKLTYSPGRAQTSDFHSNPPAPTPQRARGPLQRARELLMQAVILAGGLGTRLGARTRDLPKALIPIAGRPFLAWLVEALARHGYRKLVLCIGHYGEQIID